MYQVQKFRRGVCLWRWEARSGPKVVQWQPMKLTGTDRGQANVKIEPSYRFPDATSE